MSGNSPTTPATSRHGLSPPPPPAVSILADMTAGGDIALTAVDEIYVEAGVTVRANDNGDAVGGLFLHAARSITALAGSALGAGAARLHVARTVARRAERSAWAAYEVHGETMNRLAITYLNRLSDLLFILARYENRERGDVLWVPGGERAQ